MKEIELVSQYRNVHLLREGSRYAVIIQARNSMQIHGETSAEGTTPVANGFSDQAVNYVASWRSRSAAYKLYKETKEALDIPIWAKL